LRDTSGLPYQIAASGRFHPSLQSTYRRRAAAVEMFARACGSIAFGAQSAHSVCVFAASLMQPEEHE
jgi:hypothetical protein